MANEPYRVLPMGKKWQVKRNRAARPASSHAKKSTAIKAAKRIARRNRVGVIIHDRKGRVQRGHTHKALCG